MKENIHSVLTDDLPFLLFTDTSGHASGSGAQYQQQIQFHNTKILDINCETRSAS